MATSKKSVTAAAMDEAKVVTPKPATTKAAKPAAKKAPAKKVPAKAPVVAKKAAAPKKAKPAAVKSAEIDPTQRAHYIEVAAYYIAERRGFTPGDAAQDYLDAAAEIDRLIEAGHFSK